MRATVEQRVAALEAELAALKAQRAPTTSSDELLTIAQAAELQHCSTAALHKRAQRGTLPIVRRGRSILVRRGDL